MSLKASTRSSSNTTVAGICRSMILQNRQSAMGHNSTAMMMYRRAVPVALLTMFALLVPLTSMLRAAEVASVDVRNNLTYYSGEGADKYRHRLDLYLPKGKRDVPVVMFVHGGGFTVGIKDQYAFVGQVFAANGIATAVISYRLSPKTSYPGHVQDVARAFAWLRAHAAEFGGKVDKIFISGHSAGATLVGESLDHIAGVIPISGSFSQSARSGMFDNPYSVDPDVVRNASAINHVA